MQSLITVEEAFSGKNFETVKEALGVLNSNGIYDFNFSKTVEKLITSKESWNNFLTYLPPSSPKVVKISFF